jgi:hypothetical protein
MWWNQEVLGSCGVGMMFVVKVMVAVVQVAVVKVF